MTNNKQQSTVVKINKELHKKLKIRAIMEEKTLEKLIEELLQDENRRR